MPTSFWTQEGGCMVDLGYNSFFYTFLPLQIVSLLKFYCILADKKLQETETLKLIHSKKPLLKEKNTEH